MASSLALSFLLRALPDESVTGDVPAVGRPSPLGVALADGDVLEFMMDAMISSTPGVLI